MNLETLVDYVDSAEELTRTAREMSEKCRDYYDHKQYTEAELSTLAKRGQPAITNNRIKPKVDYLWGLEQRNRTDPKAYPRTPQHEKEADTASAAINYVCDKNQFDFISSDGFKNLIIEGTEGAEVTVRKGRDGFEIVIKRYEWDRILIDPYSRSPNCDDAKYKGGVVWMDLEDAKIKFKDYADELQMEVNKASATDDTYEDTPRYWVDGRRKRVKVCLMYFREEGQWMYAWFTAGSLLSEIKPSPFVDENGDSECPLIFQSAFVDRNGKRYGMVQQYLDLQDEINKRRSKYMHSTNSRQTFSTKGAAGENITQIKRQLAKPDGHAEFEYGEFGKDFGIIPTSDMDIAQFNLLNEAKAEIDNQGVNAAMSGNEGRSMSGRALQARQQGGSIELTPLFDAHKQWKLRIYRAIWNRIRQYWTEERWIRVTDNEDSLKWIGLNQRFTLKQFAEQNGIPVPPQFANMPEMNQEHGRNEIAKLDVDIVIDETQDFVTMQHEAAAMLHESIRASGQGAPLDFLIDITPGLPQKQKWLEKLRGDEQQQAMRQKQAEIAAQKEQAGIRKDNASAAKNETDAMKNMHEIRQTVPI